MLVTEFCQPIVSSPSIRPHHASRLYHCPDCRLKTFASSINHPPHPDTADAFLRCLCGDYYQCFPFCTTPTFARTLAADEDLIYLDHATKSVSARSYHSSSKLV